MLRDYLLKRRAVFLSSRPVPAGDASKSSDNSQGDQLRTTTSSRRMLPSEVPSSLSVSTSVNLLSQFRSSSFRESHASANLRNRLGVNEPVVRIMLYALFFNSLLIIMGTLLCCYAYAHSLDSHSPILTIAYERPFLMFMNPPATCATIFVLPLIFVCDLDILQPSGLHHGCLEKMHLPAPISVTLEARSTHECERESGGRGAAVVCKSRNQCECVSRCESRARISCRGPIDFKSRYSTDSIGHRLCTPAAGREACYAG